MTTRRVHVDSPSNDPSTPTVRRRLSATGTGQPADSNTVVPAWRRSGSEATSTAVPTAAEDAPGLKEQITSERLADAEEELRRRMSSARSEVDWLRQVVRDLATETAAAATRDRTQTVAQVQQAREQATAEARDSSQVQVTQAEDTIREVVEAAAHGPASACWDFLLPAPSANVPGLLRLGEMEVGGVTVPALVPLLNEPGVYLTGDREVSEQLVMALLTRIVAMVPLRHLKVEVFDPRLRGIMGRFSNLRNAFGSNFPPPTSDATAFVSRLSQVMESAGSNVEVAMASGAKTLTDMWSTVGVPEGQLNLCVVLDYPYAVDARLQEQLMRAASIGGPSGTSLIVVADGASAVGQDVHPDALSRRLRTMANIGGRWRSSDLPSDILPDPVPPPDVLMSVISWAIEAAASLQGPVIPINDLIVDDLRQPWTGSSAEALDMVIGREKSLPLTLSLRTENPPHPNVLIGGAVGQGKSNLLLDIIYALAARYSPHELELNLLDFKRGLEFKRFAEDEDGRNWLPHVKVLCLESSPAFGVAVLRHMELEMERRSQIFKAAGVASLNAYRAGGREMPRVVLIIDEFHVLFEGSDAEVENAVLYLTKLAKQGRAYGIHLLLASQTISGVSALSTKGDAIFAQFPLRMSLKNTADESQTILSRGNKAAADLTYRGELILNRNFGHDPVGSNVRGVAAFADPDSIRQLQADLWNLGHDEPPLMFLGSSFADFRYLQLPATPNGEERLPLWIGRPISVSTDVRALTLTPDVDQAVAVVGQDAELAVASLRSMVQSATPALAAKHGRIVLLQAGEESVVAPLMVAIDRAAQGGVTVQVVARADVASFLRDELASRLQVDVEPWLVVGVGLQRVRGMDERAVPEDGGFGLTFGAVDDGTPRSVLRDTATQGALAGVHLVAWWPNLRAARADLPQGVGIGAYVTAGLGGEDLKDLVGGLTPAIDGWPRVGLYDLNGQATLEVLVPFDPTLDLPETTP